MATGHFYLNSSSPGAPTLSSGAGNMIPILDWALDVSGAVYWEKVFTGTNKAVYRSKTGLRPYLRIDDSATEYCQFRMYETMTDVDTGTGACPDGITQTVSTQRFPKADASDGAAAHEYHIVGDSEFFILAVNHDNGYTLDGQMVRYCPMAFGEIASMLSVDNYPALLMQLHSYTATGADYHEADYHMFDDRSGYYTGVTTDNATIGDPGYNPALVWLRNASGTVNSSGGTPWALNNAVSFRADIENPISISPYYIQCSNGSTSSSSTAYWNPGNGGAVVRGRMPYVYRGCWRAGSLYGGPVSNDIITIGSSQYVVMVSWGDDTTDAWGQGTYLFRITDDEPDRP